jgi:hypothetical protein
MAGTLSPSLGLMKVSGLFLDELEGGNFDEVWLTVLGMFFTPNADPLLCGLL